MQLESHATPTVETPQQRYASLHRAIERGLASDEVWKELADVSLRLGHGDEAVRCMHRIRNEAMRMALESRLVRLRLIDENATDDGAKSAHDAVPAASYAGPLVVASEEGHRPGLREHVFDAVQYMFHQHMPWLVLTTTLAFPLVIGVGGFLTAGGSLLLLAAIAALPGLCVLAIVGAMGRQILIASSEGMSDVPAVPDFGVLVADGRRFLLDAGLVLGTLVAPPAAALALGAPIATALPCLVVGGFFAPLAWALRQVRGDFGALSPVTMLRGFQRCGTGYIGIVGLAWLLFAPAALVTWAVFGRPIWVQLAAVGPLCVVPIFLLSRLLGTWLDTMRMQLGAVLTCSPRTQRPQTHKPQPKGVAARAAAKAAEARPPQRGPQARPGAPVRGAAAPARPGPTPNPPRRASRTPAAPARTSAKRPTPPPRETAPAQPRARASQPPAPRAEPTKPTARAIEGVGPKSANTAPAGPDLANLPGAVVVSGLERQRLGAAARKK
ncbi:MAG TPA: hypothetical protein VFZ65_17895 [Planctomycetota bacterium]|nr:hypothetical protein [Planctomycetota bacterium]